MEENVNNSFFDGYYKEIWRSIIPQQLSEKEVEFMIPYFELVPGSKVLDLMCGYGRHSILLARKGIEVEAIDNLQDYIDEILKAAETEQLPIKAIRADVASYGSDEIFDLAICMGNSLNFFDSKDAYQLLANTCKMIRQDGHILINSWSLAEIAIPGFKKETSSEINGLKYEAKMKYCFQPTRIEFETNITGSDGKTQSKLGIDYIYSVSEIERMLNESGFTLVEIFSIPGRKKFELGDPRAYIVAQKIS